MPQAYDTAGISHLRQYLTEHEARDQAAELELQYDAHGFRPADTVRRVDPPVPVESWHHAGVLDAWVRENGEWIGRIRADEDGAVVWRRQAELRRAGEENV